MTDTVLSFTKHKLSFIQIIFSAKRQFIKEFHTHTSQSIAFIVKPGKNSDRHSTGSKQIVHSEDASEDNRNQSSTEGYISSEF